MKSLPLIFVTLFITIANLQAEEAGNIRKELLGTHQGSEVYRYILTNKAGNTLYLTNYGARIIGVEVPDRNGVKADVVLGSDNLESVLRDAFG